MAKPARKRPTAIVRLERGRLVAVSPWDAELLSGESQGQEFDLIRRSARSRAHNSMYWAQLSLIVKATGAWPTAEHMHDWVKAKLGYVEPVIGPDGRVIQMKLDSTSFGGMDQATFNGFYEKFAALVAEEMEIDVADVRPEMRNDT